MPKYDLKVYAPKYSDDFIYSIKSDNPFLSIQKGDSFVIGSCYIDEEIKEVLKKYERLGIVKEVRHSFGTNKHEELSTHYISVYVDLKPLKE